MYPHEKIAKILRTDKDVIKALEEKLSVSTGKKNIMEKIVEENGTAIRNRLETLGLENVKFAKDIYSALIKKIERDNDSLTKALGDPKATVSKDWERVLEVAKESAGRPKGFFLKKEKAIEFLLKEPPQKLINLLGYRDVNELINKEDVFEIFPSLRFVEGGEWLNEVFFKQYEGLKAEDFEEREIMTKALPEKWARLAESFIKKKYHNVSHLKELGVIYVIPIALEISGEVLRNFGLLLHYFNEVSFYSDLFKRFSAGADFSKNITSLLRGDVIDKQMAESEKSLWLVIQRYLAKDDENDWRLFAPHINPEALHWDKAERLLIRAGRNIDHLESDLYFWQDLNWVGDYFKSDAGIDVLVSFNLIDSSMSLVQQKELTKYLYHHQESMWNKIFSEYFGLGKMEEIMKENIIKGWFEI